MGSVFEAMCQYYALKKGISEEFGSLITNVGAWWEVENTEEKGAISADIDVIGISNIDKCAIVGECKFKNEKIDKTIYETLVRRSKLIDPKYKITKYILFSLLEFTVWFENLKDEDVLTLTLDSIYV